MGKATQDLRNEHDSILHVLLILDKTLTSEKKDEAAIHKFGGELIYFLKTFADKCHHGKEENYLFEKMVHRGVPKEGGPIGVMLAEHKLGREYIAQMAGAVDSKDLAKFTEAAEMYRDLLRPHIQKENTILFVMADRLLDDAAQEAMFEKFEQHEESVIGHGVHEELHAMIHQWENQFGDL
jgi:hemerythrin-like domain-containing protein